MTEAAIETIDILIIGAGPVGMTLHLALAAGGQKSLLLDRRPQNALQADPRALALSHGARELLVLRVLLALLHPLRGAGAGGLLRGFTRLLLQGLAQRAQVGQ